MSITMDPVQGFDTNRSTSPQERPVSPGLQETSTGVLLLVDRRSQASIMRSFLLHLWISRL